MPPGSPARSYPVGSQRRLCAPVCLLLAALLALVSPAAAAESLDVLSVGWDGTVVPGAWSPIRVRVAGGASDVNARVDVVVKYRMPSPGGPTPISIPDQVVGAYGQDVALPAGTTKELTIWAPMVPSQSSSTSNQPGTVRIVVGGQVLATQDVEFRSGPRPQLPLFGVLSDAETVHRGVASTTMPYQGLPVPLTTARLSPGDLPTAGERLEAFKGIVIQGGGAAQLTSEQRQALCDWVAEGGHLVLAGGPDAARSTAALPPGALPMALGTLNSGADLAPLARWLGNPDDPVGTGPITRLEARGGTVLVGDESSPLIWRTGLGRGTVTLLAFDPGLEPLASWRGMPALIQKTLEPALASVPSGTGMPSGPGYYGGPSYVGGPTRLQSAVDALPPEAYPSLSVVAMLLGGFALAVGPVAHLLLRRLDRRELVWLVVPGAALTLVAVLYVVGIGRDGRDVLANVVAHVRIVPEERRASADVVAGYFSPTRQQLTVTGPGSEPMRVSGPGGAAYGYPTMAYGPGYTTPYGWSSAYSVGGTSGADGGLPFAVITGRDTRVEFGGGQWGMRTLALERSVGGEIGQITPNLRLQDGVLTGTVRNDTPFFLENAAITAGTKVVKLGSLAPGQTAAVTLDSGAEAGPTWPGAWSLSHRLLGKDPEPGQSSRPGSPVPYGVAVGTYPGGYPYGAGMGAELPRDAETARRARLLDAISQADGSFGGSYGPGPFGPAISRPLSLVALTRSPLGVAVPTAGTHPMYMLSVVEQRLSLDIPPGPFTLPSALIPAERVRTDVSQSGRAPSSGSSGPPSPPAMSATYEFRPPLPREAVVHALDLTIPEGSAAISPRGGSSAASPAVPRSASPGQPSTQRDPTVSIYNWRTGGWDALPEGERRIRLESPESYVGAEGQVRIEIRNVPMGQNQMTPDLVVEGMVLS